MWHNKWQSIKLFSVPLTNAWSSVLSCTVLQVSLTGEHPGVHTTWSKFFTQSKHQINHLNALAVHIYIIKVNLGTMSQTKHLILMHWVVNSNFHPTRFSQNLITSFVNEINDFSYLSWTVSIPDNKLTINHW